jgi:hypothetical protein
MVHVVSSYFHLKILHSRTAKGDSDYAIMVIWVKTGVLNIIAIVTTQRLSIVRKIKYLKSI